MADLRPGGHDTLTWHVQVPAGGTGSGLTAQAIYDAGPHSTDSVQAAITAGVAYPSVASAFDDTGITADTGTGAGNIDGSGYSLSAQALASAGVTPGSTVKAGGLSFTWPAPAAGQPDNIVAGGQADPGQRQRNDARFPGHRHLRGRLGHRHGPVRRRDVAVVHAVRAGLVRRAAGSDVAILLRVPCCCHTQMQRQR